MRSLPAPKYLVTVSCVPYVNIYRQANAFVGALAIIAGADTTTSALASFVYFIMRYPKVYQRVQEEVDSLGSDLTTTEKQTKLLYLNATM
jgi:hypothetical protein